MVKIDVSFSALGDDDYGTWSEKMKMCLALEKCLTITETGLPENPTAADIEKDQHARALIGIRLSNQHLGLYKASNSAKALWDALEGMFNQKNKARRLSLRRALSSMKKSPAESLSMYFARAMKLRDELIGADQDISEDEVVCAVLAGLPYQYEVSITILQHSDKELTITDCLSSLLLVEHKLLNKEEEAPVAYHAGVSLARPGRGGGGGAYKGGRDTRVCHYCHEAGHIMSNCHARKADLKKRAGAKAAMVSFATPY
jgi:gag-polypeptide of LTR copia-type